MQSCARAAAFSCDGHPRAQDLRARRVEPGSFRDPESRVFYAGDNVYRALSTDGLNDFQALAATGLSTTRGSSRAELADGPPACRRAGEGGRRRAQARADPVRLLSLRVDRSRCSRTPRCSSSTYCSPRSRRTWSSRTRRPTTSSSWARGRCSSTSASFERLREGEPWVGYRQFCMLYLYPLLLQAVKGVRSTPWLRGSIDGITPAQMRGLVSFRDRFRKGSDHQRVPARPARAAPRRPGRGGQGGGQAGGLQKELIQSPTCASMRKLVERPRVEPAGRASGSPTASATATPMTTPSARTSSCARWPLRRAGT